MPEHPHSEDDAVVNPETHHEESDVNARALILFVVIFVVFAAVTHLALWLLFRFYVQLSKGEANPPLTAILRPADADVPQLPRLQPFPAKGETDVTSPVADTPVADMQRMRAEEEKTLNNYGWVDRQKGVARIPIEQAKQLALQRGVYQLNSGSVPVPAGVVAVPQAAGASRVSGAPAAQGESNPAGAGSTTTTGTQQ